MPDLRESIQAAVNGICARGRLTASVRQINRVFPMPVMVLRKHLTDT